MNVTDKKETTQCGAVVEALLLQQHKMLLVENTINQAVGRLLSFGLFLYVVFSANIAPSYFSLLILCGATTVISFFWWYIAKTIKEQIARLEEIIVQGEDISRDTKQQSEKFQSEKSDKDLNVTDKWKQAYIVWRHESWKHPNRERIFNLESFAWWSLNLTLIVLKIKYHWD